MAKAKSVTSHQYSLRQCYSTASYSVSQLIRAVPLTDSSTKCRELTVAKRAGLARNRVTDSVNDTSGIAVCTSE